MTESRLPPWHRLDIESEHLTQIPGMISLPECASLYWLGRDYYAGRGEIVELGCFLGTSSECLQKGLRDNKRDFSRQSRHHVYDLFEFSAEEFTPWLEPHGLKFGDSFLDVYLANMRAYQERVTIEPGDLLDKRWTRQPIEILFIDAAKSWTLSDHVVSEFFPSLIPGRSFLVQQDLFYEGCPWLAITMEHLHDYFRLVAVEQSSAYYELVKPIPGGTVDNLLAGLSFQEKLERMDRAIERTTGKTAGWYAQILMLAKCTFLADFGHFGPAQKLALKLYAATEEEDIKIRATDFLIALKRIATSSRDLLSPAENALQPIRSLPRSMARPFTRPLEEMA